jgi:GH25 family lysozyme M1 (1,4-beta-N-acetylmuramidase)
MNLSRRPLRLLKNLLPAALFLAVAISASAQRPLGIDVSSYQGSADKPPTNINWPVVATKGITFAWAKATEGLTYNDADFVYNVSNAVASGILIGAYHFAHPETHLGLAGADEEAAHFWSIASNYLTGSGNYLMPVLDYETAPGSSYTKATSSQWANEWCQDIANYGASNGVLIVPIIYTYTSFATTWLNSSVTNWPLWMAASLNGQTPQTGAPFSTAPWTTWNFWQYGQGNVSGIEGAVDEDVFNGTTADLAAYVISPYNLLPTMTTIGSLPPRTYGQTIFVSATVDPAPGGGELQFYTNGVAWNDPLDATGGEASLFTSFLPAGFYAVTANFTGAFGYEASSSTNNALQEIDPAPLSITPAAQQKVYGTTLTIASPSTNFSASGLQNGESVGSVMLGDPANGGAATAPVGTYSLIASNAQGGSFNPSNYNISYNPGTLTVTLPSNTIPVVIRGIGFLTNGTLQLNLTGTPGYVYYIQAATNLLPPVTWLTISTNPADANGNFSFSESEQTNNHLRFFRTLAE